MVETFSRVIRAKLRDRASPSARDYQHSLVDSVVVDGDKATISWSHSRLTRIITGKKMGTAQVSTFIPEWRANGDEPGHWKAVVTIRYRQSP